MQTDTLASHGGDTASTDGGKSDTTLLPWLPRFSKLLASIEEVIGQRFTGLLIGLSLLCIAAFYVTPALYPVNNGVGFSQMSHDPFKMDANPFRHRILSPLLGYYLGFRGDRFIYFPLIVTVVFLGAIYAHFRRLGHSQVLALAASATMAFSGPVLFLLHFQGYTDVLTHLLLFWCFVLRRSKFLWVILLALACLNHEASLFSLPWIVAFRALYYTKPLFSARGISHFVLDILLAVAATVPMFMLKKLWPLENAQYTPGFYLSLAKSMWMFIFPFAGFGIFEAFKLFWFIPLFAILTTKRGSLCSTFVVLFLMFAAGAGQLVFSHDISRHVGHAFPIILFSLELLLSRKFLGSRLSEVLLIVVFCNFFVPQYYVGQHDAWPFLPVPVSFLFWMFGLDPWHLHFNPWG
ncbi:MAG: hypothetical protein RL518_2794 [Pseudomonadota bacterium]|jgi:hypothetical protein